MSEHALVQPGSSPCLVEIRERDAFGFAGAMRSA